MHLMLFTRDKSSESINPKDISRNSTLPCPLPPELAPPWKDIEVTEKVCIYSAPNPCQRRGPATCSSQGLSGLSTALLAERGRISGNKHTLPRVAGMASGPAQPVTASVSPVRRFFSSFKGQFCILQLRLSPSSPIYIHMQWIRSQMLWSAYFPLLLLHRIAYFTIP